MNKKEFRQYLIAGSTLSDIFCGMFIVIGAIALYNDNWFVVFFSCLGLLSCLIIDSVMLKYIKIVLRRKVK